MNNILHWNSIGIIPGPQEKKEDFEARAKYCLDLKQTVLPHLFEDETKNSFFLPQAFPATQFWCGTTPSWVTLIFSNDKLAPWHGGAAWIFQMENDAPTGALLQMREEFLYKEKYLGCLKREELIAHELSHIGRMMFEEPQFEEILAYRTSDSWLAKNLGPLLQSSKESMVFVCLLFFIMLVDIIFLYYNSNLISIMWLKLFPAGLALFAIFRLLKNKRKLQHALANILKMTQSEETANAILYRLTDKEIALFAKSSISEIRDYIEEQGELRWQVIREAYL